MYVNNFLRYSLPYFLIELAVAAACVFLIFGVVSRKPDSRLVSILQHRGRMWFAFGLFLLPRIIGQIFMAWRIDHLDQTASSVQMYLVIGMVLQIFYGAAYGLVGCLMSVAAGKMNRGRALGIAAGLVLLGFAAGTVLGPVGFRGYFLADIFVALVFLVFAAAQIKIRTRDGSPSDGVAAAPKVPPIYALVLAFVPSVMLLLIWTILASGNNSASRQPSAAMLILCCLVSIFCCFTSSFLLFRRGTGLAILVGILFLLLNACVSFLFGCGAILSGMKF